MQLTVNCVRLSSAQFSPLVWPMPQWHIQDLNSFTSLLVTQQFIHRTHLVSVQVSLFGRHRIALFMAMSFAYPAWLMTSSGSGNGSIRPANSPTSLRFFIARPFVNHFASTWNRPLFVSWRKTQTQAYMEGLRTKSGRGQAQDRLRFRLGQVLSSL